MAKKTVALDGLLQSDPPPAERGVAASEPSPAKQRGGEKRVTVALDGVTYRRLRLHAANTDLTHQAILQYALAEYLKRANA